MRCIITPSGLVLQATNYIDYETLSAIIYSENCILQIIKMLHEMQIDIIL